MLALVALRELSPALRDQLISVSTRDRELAQARAMGLDEKTPTTSLWRQMLTFKIVGSAVSIVLFLSGYFMLVGFLVIYMATTFGYSEAEANALGNWYWIANAILLIVGGSVRQAARPQAVHARRCTHQHGRDRIVNPPAPPTRTPRALRSRSISL